MPPHPLHRLLPALAHRAMLVVAIMAMVASLLRLPCALADSHAPAAPAATHEQAVAGDTHPTGTDATDPDGCGWCHLCEMASAVVPDAHTWIAQGGDGSVVRPPHVRQLVDDPACAPDIPPDRI